MSAHGPPSTPAPDAHAPGSTLRVRAHAKLNLALAASPPIAAEGPRKGWHEIASWFAPIDLHDTLTVTRLEGGRLSAYAIDWAREGTGEAGAPRPTAIDWPVTKDLGVRAHLLLEREAGRALPIRMRVEKRIPVGGGLGGGSSDAAAALLAVNELFGLGLAIERLRELSRELGSDVAFFLDEAGLITDAPRPAFVSGFGDRIERTPAVRGEGDGSAHAVLVFPEFGCATPAVYKAFDAIDPATLRPSARFEERAQSARTLATRAALVRDLAGELFNDLAPAAEVVAPALRELREALRRACELEAHVTGSGSTLFFVARDGDHAAWTAARAAEHALAIVARA